MDLYNGGAEQLLERELSKSLTKLSALAIVAVALVVHICYINVWKIGMSKSSSSSIVAIALVVSIASKFGK